MPVVAISCGFKPHLPHYIKRKNQVAEQMSTGRFATSSALCKRKSQVLELDSFFFDFRSESMTAVFYVVDNVLEIRVKELD